MTEDDNESDDPSEDGMSMESEAEVTCPYCGEVVMIALDAGGGTDQEYVEDCEVCCQPWQVKVSFGRGGAQVWVTES